MRGPMPTPDDAALARLGARLDWSECVPCGGKCCKTPWTVFASPRDIERLSRATGRPPASFAKAAPLPAWEVAAFGEGNLLFPRVAAQDGSVPQLRKREDGACVFLDERGLCGVHGSKPLMCRLFPFYYAEAPATGEARSPLGTHARDASGRTWLLLVDRGHEGMCPITTERMAEVEQDAGDAAMALMAAFEADVAAYEREKERYVAQFPRA